MTFNQALAYINQELKSLYPETEIEAFAQIICRHLFGLSRFECMLRNNAPIPEKSQHQIYNIIQELKGFKPIQYILGETEFFGLRFFVDEAVLIPRPETEELVEWVIRDQQSKGDISILDIGTGSGCIAVTLARKLPNATVSAIDVSLEALTVAEKNAIENKVNIAFYPLDIINEKQAVSSAYDVIVSNPPYVTFEQKERMSVNVLNYEPHLALFASGQNPFVFYEVISEIAHTQLKPGGAIYFEINEEHPGQTAKIIESYGFSTELKQDMHGKYRMIKAQQE